MRRLTVMRSRLCLTRLFAVVGVAQDVTEDRKHAQALREMQYLRASQEAKVETERNMTAYFAHELRNRTSNLFVFSSTRR